MYIHFFEKKNEIKRKKYENIITSVHQIFQIHTGPLSIVVCPDSDLLWVSAGFLALPGESRLENL